MHFYLRHTFFCSLSIWNILNNWLWIWLCSHFAFSFKVGGNFVGFWQIMYFNSILLHIHSSWPDEGVGKVFDWVYSLFPLTTYSALNTDDIFAMKITNFVPNSFSHFNSFVTSFVIFSRFTARSHFKTETFKQSTFKCNQIENFLAILYKTKFENITRTSVVQNEILQKSCLFIYLHRNWITQLSLL